MVKITVTVITNINLSFYQIPLQSVRITSKAPLASVFSRNVYSF